MKEIGLHHCVVYSSIPKIVDPCFDIRWVFNSEVNPMELFADGRIDAFLAAPPEAQELRARKIGQLGRPPVVAIFLLHARGE